MNDPYCDNEYCNKRATHKVYFISTKDYDYDFYACENHATVEEDLKETKYLKITKLGEE